MAFAVSVLKNGDVFLATRITGPTHNMLALDFTAGRDSYVKDLADTDCSPDFAAKVEEQVLRGFDELGVARDELVGIQFNGGDTPSDSAYYELATAILKTRASGDEVEQFVPQWSPTSELTDEAE